MSTPWKLSLKESPRRAILQTKPDYDILLNGKKVDRAYFNMQGYRCALPLPEGGKIDLGELPLSKLRKEVAALNREARDKGITARAGA